MTGRVGSELPQARQGGQPVHAGQPHVEDDGVGFLEGDLGKRLLGRRGHGHGVAFARQRALQRPANGLLVIDDQDVPGVRVSSHTMLRRKPPRSYRGARLFLASQPEKGRTRGPPVTSRQNRRAARPEASPLRFAAKSRPGGEDIVGPGCRHLALDCSRTHTPRRQIPPVGKGGPWQATGGQTPHRRVPCIGLHAPQRMAFTFAGPVLRGFAPVPRALPDDWALAAEPPPTQRGLLQSVGLPSARIRDANASARHPVDAATLAGTSRRSGIHPDCQIPQLDCLVNAARSQHLTVGAIGYGVNLACMPTYGGDFPPRLHVP